MVVERLTSLRIGQKELPLPVYFPINLVGEDGIAATRLFASVVISRRVELPISGLGF